jgi:hypothetical protein
MGSHQEPDPISLPFGCKMLPHGHHAMRFSPSFHSFHQLTGLVSPIDAIPIESIDPGLDNAFEVPPVGSQLLSENESQVLEKFFSAEVLGGLSFNVAAQVPLGFGEGVDTLYEYSDLWLATHLPNPGGDDHLPYSFEALPSSYQYVAPSDTMAAPPPTGGNLNQPADVLAAASVLSSGANGPHMNMSFGVSPMPATSTASVPTPAAQMRHYSMGGYGSAESNMIPRNGNDGMLRSMVFGGADPSAQPMNRRPQQHPEIQYGTDPNFSRHRYEPQTWNGTLQAIRHEQAKLMDCFERTDSAAPTRASSPTPVTMRLPEQHSVLSPVTQTTTIAMPQPNQPAAFSAPILDEDEGTPPRKKAKCKADPADEVDSVRLPTKPKGARSGKAAVARPESPLAAEKPAPPPPKKRRRTGNRDLSPPKPRENLTDEQKRENHIKSEQKRRQMIADGYNEMTKVIPGLEASGLSKSLMLQTAGTFLENLKSGNERLRAQLEALKAAEEASNGGGSNG